MKGLPDRSDEGTGLAVIVSDDHGQFRVSDHAPCWVHAERLVHKLVPGRPHDQHLRAGSDLLARIPDEEQRRIADVRDRNCGRRGRF